MILSIKAMLSRTERTNLLSLKLEQYLNPKLDSHIYTAREVTLDYSSDQWVRVDYMRFLPKNNSVSGIEKGDFYCYEIKSCIDDFHSKHGHNFAGDFNYYVMTESLFQQVCHEIPYGVGVLVPKGSSLTSIKPAKRRNREKSVSELLLMMFRSANRDLVKLKKEGVSCAEITHT